MVSPLLVKGWQYGQTLRTFGTRRWFVDRLRETLEEVREAMRSRRGRNGAPDAERYSIGEDRAAQIAMGRSGYTTATAAAIIWTFVAISRKTIPSTVAWSP
ncbi:MAG: hypothetical protein ACLTTP_00965 [Alistipes ihumii]